ncbi:MAG TPA: alpha/beta fold hydrolase [Candidatus Mediterraneibacter excrementigallinarum]|nr:alpha/beta fold hydrolase [Candidatus Mediterraneibacter excrementigallinarum]
MAVFTASAIGTMHVVNRIFSHIALENNLFDEDSFEYYDWRFGRIAYKKIGQGAPVLLIHDLNVCSSSYEWYKTAEKLSETNTVYMIDLLGCGLSDRPLLTYTNFLYVQLLTDFIKHIIGQKTDVIVSGHSSSFVLMACANDESIINRVIMINPEDIINLSKIPTKKSNMIKNLILTPILGTFIYNMRINKKTIRETLVKACCSRDNVREKDVLISFESTQREKAHSKYLYACQCTGYTNVNILNCLKKLNNSIFIITGTKNPENTLAAAQYQNHLPSIEIIGIDQTKQLPHIENPDEFINQVNIFLSDEE